MFARPVPHPLDEVRGLLFSVSDSGGLRVRERLFVQPCVDGAFLRRVATIVRGSMTGRADEFGRLLDPTETVEPRTLFCG